MTRPVHCRHAVRPAGTRPLTPRIVLSLTVVLPMLPLTGCAKKVIAAVAPPPPPTATVSVPPPSHPSVPLPQAPVIVSAPVPLPVETAKKPVPLHSRTRSVPPVEVAVVTTPSVTELGELTTGGESNNDALRRETDDLLKTQNRRLSSLSGGATALHTKQVEQARLFLRQAGDAWNKQDIEGARTLATKAKVLLDEVLQ